MSSLSKNSGSKIFHTIYVEESAFDYPLTQHLLERYSDCTIIRIRHYKDVFNRPNQHFSVQKDCQALILAVKEEPFLYRGPEICQNFGHANFYYTSFMLNCIYDCSYCYLQGMYPSANIVAFVNTEQFTDAIEKAAAKEPVFLAASYDTDLIAFNNVIGTLDLLYDFFAKTRGLTVEVRTKSANKSFYSAHTPSANIIIAFTLTPQQIIERHERKTPSLALRIEAIKTAIARGFNVRICFDPVFVSPHTESLYEPFFAQVFNEIAPNSILDVGYGFFRMPLDFYRRIEKIKSYAGIFAEEYTVDDGVVSYSKELQDAATDRHLDILSQYIEKERIFIL